MDIFASPVGAVFNPGHDLSDRTGLECLINSKIHYNCPCSFPTNSEKERKDGRDGRNDLPPRLQKQL